MVPSTIPSTQDIFVHFHNPVYHDQHSNSGLKGKFKKATGNVLMFLIMIDHCLSESHL